MKALVRWSVEHPVGVGVLLSALVITGLYSLYKLKIDLLPDVSMPTITVITPYPGADPGTVERNVTVPLEDALRGISGVVKVKSRSTEEYSQIELQFSYDKDLDAALMEVSERIRGVRLPEGAGKPTVIPFDPSVFPIITVTFPESQRGLVKHMWRDRVLGIKDVALVPLLFTSETYTRVSLKPDRLALYRIPPRNVIMAIKDRMYDVPADGAVLSGRLDSLHHLRDVIVGFYGRPVFLYEVADVSDYEERYEVLQLNNDTPAVISPVFKVSGANTYEVGRKIKEVLGEIARSGRLKFWVAMDQSFLIEKVVKEVANSAFIGGLLAVLFVVLFTRSVRLALAISLSIPPAIVISLMALHFFGYTLNAMTLVGMALAIGMIVDNSVVVSENIYRLRGLGLPDREAAVEGASQVILPITASTLTTIIVFFPVVYLSGPIGRIAENVAVAVVFSLLSTLLIAVSVTPTYVRFILGKVKGGVPIIATLYRRFLSWYLSGWKAPLTVGLVLLLPFLLVPFIGGEFLPVLDSDFIYMEVELPPNTPFEKTANYMRSVSRIFSDIPEVENYAVFVSAPKNIPKGILAYGGGATETYKGQAFVRLKERSKRKRTQQEIEEEILRRLPPFPGRRVKFLPVERLTMFGMAGKAVSVGFTGRDVSVLTAIAKRFAKELEKVPGIRNVEVVLRPGRPVEVWRVKEEVKALGTSVALTQADLYVLRHGYDIGEIEGKKVVVASDTSYPVETYPVVGDSGVGYAEDYVRIDTAITPAVIDRENGLNVVYVRADRTTPNLLGVYLRVRSLLNGIHLPEGYGYTLGGEVVDLLDMLRQLTLAGILAVILVYAVLVAQFESLRMPFVIATSVVYGLAGALAFMFLFRVTFSLVSALGILVSAGVVVNNGIVMLSMARQLKDLPPKERIVEAAFVRLRPILITTITTLMGLLPMMFMVSEGFEYRRPIAVALFGGLLWGTLFSLFVLPFLYVLTERR